MLLRLRIQEFTVHNNKIEDDTLVQNTESEHRIQNTEYRTQNTRTPNTGLREEKQEELHLGELQKL